MIKAIEKMDSIFLIVWQKGMNDGAFKRKVRNPGCALGAEKNADDYRDFLELEDSGFLFVCGAAGLLPEDFDESSLVADPFRSIFSISSMLFFVF